MATEYEIYSAKRAVSVQDASSAQEAVLSYVRSLGSQDDEITRLGVDTVAWRGAVFQAVPAASDDPLS
ncbi:MAG: hypothetical protein M3364_04625 [Actinomycetota bacterium]|nr:hypothetical protein [Actinomycetota bacterium]